MKKKVIKIAKKKVVKKAAKTRLVKKTVVKKAAIKKKAKKIAPKKALAQKVTKKRVLKKVVKKVTSKKQSSSLSILGKKIWVLNVPFEWRAWASTQGVRWSPEHRVSYFAGDNLPEPLKHMKSKPFSYQRYIENKINGCSSDSEFSDDKWTPKKHQLVASEAIRKEFDAGGVGFLLADAVGVGKTISAWNGVIDISNVAELNRVIVVTTVSAIPHWRRTIQKMKEPRVQDIIITNYEQLGNFFERPDDMSLKKKNLRKRIAKNGKAETFDLIVFDESHKGQNMDSARGIMMIELSMKSGFSIWASATAGGTPLKLVYLIKLLAQQTGSSVKEMKKDFEGWCLNQNIGIKRGAFGKWIWEPIDGAIEKVYGWIFDGGKVGMRRLPKDISGWPDMERQVYPQELNPIQMKEYELEWEIFQESVLNRRAGRKDSAGILVEQLRFRQKSSILRVESTVSIIEEQLEKGNKVAVSLAFHDTMQMISEALMAKKIKVAMIHGRIDPDQKEEERLKFQKTDEADVVLFTVEEAISLHEGEYIENDRPRVLLIHDIRWSAIQLDQIEGRCHRDGKFAPTCWLFSEGTIEEKIVESLVQRVINMRMMLGDKVDDVKLIEEMIRKESKV